jgi:hypothetical protein
MLESTKAMDHVKAQVEKQVSLYIVQQNKKCSSDSNDEFHAIEYLGNFNYRFKIIKVPKKG